LKSKGVKAELEFNGSEKKISQICIKKLSCSLWLKMAEIPEYD